jgi:hypothetical protein
VKRNTSPTIDFRAINTEALMFNKETGWISWQRSDGACPVRLCWLPRVRRGESFAWFDTTAVIGSRHGAVTILDLSDVMSGLRRLGL